MELDARARRLLRRMPRTSVYSLAEILLIILLALQCARLFWTLLTPVGPLGEWRAKSALQTALPGAGGALSAFDPFFRLTAADSGPAVVTALDLNLHGVRGNLATGRGAAIIGFPGGEQKSFVVGEEIMPGVVLSSVAFDSVTISRDGRSEQLFLDQSPPATVVSPPPRPASPPAPPPPPPVVEAGPRDPLADEPGPPPSREDGEDGR